MIQLLLLLSFCLVSHFQYVSSPFREAILMPQQLHLRMHIGQSGGNFPNGLFLHLDNSRNIHIFYRNLLGLFQVLIQGYHLCFQ
jgi:hypothetical protein